MSGLADNIEPPEWLRVPDSPSKVGPPNWLPLEDAFRRMRDRLKSSDLAKRDLYAWLCGPLPSAVRRIGFSGQQGCDLLRPEFWQQQIRLWVESDDVDHIGIHYCDRSHRSLDGREYFFVWAEAFERLCSTEASVPAPPPPAPSKEPKRTLRRRHSKYPWNEICGEIARLCIDPGTQRVRVPKNESELTEKVLQFCLDTLGCEPPVSDMREAVAAICAALRKI